MSFVLLIAHIIQDKMIVHEKYIYTKRATVAEVVNNASSQRFLKDSLMDKNPPYRQPFIQVKMSPLNFRIIGLTTEVMPGVYLVQLNSQYPVERLQRTFFHELVHVYQMHNGLLKEGMGIVFWMGQLSTWQQPWGERAWEIHAEKWTDEMFVPNEPICE